MAAPESVDNKLMEALAAYVTKGSVTQSTTRAELEELLQTASARPGGRAALEAFAQEGSSPFEHTIWKSRTAASGIIDMAKTNLEVKLEVPSLELSFHADGAGFFMPYKGSLNQGIIYYNDSNELNPGDATFELHVHGLSLEIKIYRDQVNVAFFRFQPMSFVLPPGGISLNGTIV